MTHLQEVEDTQGAASVKVALAEAERWVCVWAWVCACRSLSCSCLRACFLALSLFCSCARLLSLVFLLFARFFSLALKHLCASSLSRARTRAYNMHVCIYVNTGKQASHKYVFIHTYIYIYLYIYIHTRICSKRNTWMWIASACSCAWNKHLNII